MAFKDLFSSHAADYKRFRPTYPEDLFQFIANQADDHHAVWDCATGSGQAAKQLANYFSTVYATDASSEQIDHAEPADNIIYQVSSAEQSGLASNSVSLITVFQALHWFNLEGFLQEVKRVAKPGSVLAIFGYNTALTGIKEVDSVYREFCFDYLWKKDCWDMERNTLNNNYETVELPVNPIKTPAFEISMSWTYQDYIAYLNTWSAVKKYIKKYESNPVETFVIPKISQSWPDKNKARAVKFPLIIRVGRLIP